MADITSSRADEIAERFLARSEEFIAYLETLTESQWLTIVPAEERTVAALAHHVGWAFMFEMDAFTSMAEGRDHDLLTRQGLAEINARNGDEYAEWNRHEAVLYLREEAALAADAVRRLSDDQLAQQGQYIDDRPSQTVEDWLTRVLIGHIENHERGIREELSEKDETS